SLISVDCGEGASSNVYEDLGRYTAAEPLYERSLAIREKALGPEHPFVATGLNNLAKLYDDQGRYADAEPLYKRSLADAASGNGHKAQVSGSVECTFL